nr:hypothetical protein [Tanacetum cinerariifolium]
MTERNDYIFVTQKNCISNDKEGRMIERNFIEIQGAFLVKIRDNTFNGIIGENAFEHIYKFLEVVSPIKINRDHKWSDELGDGKLKEETLLHKVKVKESFGNATPGLMKLCAWLINSFGNFHELDYNVLVKLQECWWKINAHEVAPFTRLESYDQRPYANIKTEKGHEERMDDPILESSVSKIRRFKMIKYSFNADEEYIAIKESKYLNHSEENLDAYRELLRIINEGWVVATPNDE